MTLPRLFLFAAMLVGATSQACDFRLTPGAQIQLTGDYLLIATHPSSIYDHGTQTYGAFVNLLRTTKRQEIPSVVLINADDERDSYFFPGCKPEHAVASKGGELDFQFEARHVLLAGGFFRLCQRKTIQDVLTVWSKRAIRTNLSLVVLLDASYDVISFGAPRAHEVEDFNVLAVPPTAPWHAQMLDFVHNYGDWSFSLERLFRLFDRMVDPAKSQAWIKYYLTKAGITPELVDTGVPSLLYPPAHTVKVNFFYRQRKTTFSSGSAVGLPVGPTEKFWEETLIDKGPSAPVLTIHFLHSADLAGSQVWRLNPIR